MGGGLESCCVGRVYGADGAVRVACKLSTDFVDLLVITSILI